MGGKASRAALTRSLLAGVSLGSIALIQVGCEPTEWQGASGAAQSEARASGSEEELCQRAIASGDHADVEVLLQAYPGGRCVPATLSALPPETLAQVSPSVLSRMPRYALNRIPPDARIHLKTPSRFSENRGQGSRTSGSSSSNQRTAGRSSS